MELFSLPIFEKYLVYHPQTQISCLVNAPAHQLIQQRLGNSEGSVSLPESLEQIVQSLLKEKSCSPYSKQESLKPLFLGIIPTRSCNMACRYCDFDSGRNDHAVMSLEMACSAVTWYADFVKEQGKESMEIHFFGGEPLVARQVVETVLHRARMLASQYNLNSHFEVSTNGLFEPEYASFVGNYFDTVVLSLDGHERTHNLHRPLPGGRPSYEVVDRNARLLSQTPLDLCLRCCISTSNVQEMEEITHRFCREFKPSVINYEPLSENFLTASARLKAPDPITFAIQYVRSKSVAEDYGVECIYSAVESTLPRNSFCPVGQDALILSPDGRVSSCYLPSEKWQERGLNLDVGRITPEGRIQVDIEQIRTLRTINHRKPRCKTCFCKMTCAGGCHVRNTYPGSSNDFDDFCIQTRLITAINILQELGQSTIVHDLMRDREAMEKIFRRSTDVLQKEGRNNYV